MIDYNESALPCHKGNEALRYQKIFRYCTAAEGVISLGVGEPDFKNPVAHTSGSHLYPEKADLLYRKRRSDRSP